MRQSIVVSLVVVGAAVALTSSVPSRAATKGYVVVYDGYGTPTAFVVGGRVLEDKGETAPSKASLGAGGLANLVDTWKALESDEIRGAEVSVEVGGHVFTATSDSDGVFKVQVKGLSEKMAAGDLPVMVTVKKPANVEARGAGVLHIVDGPFIGLISDVDDTVVKTYVTDKRKMAGAVFLKNALQSTPVEGAAANYRNAAAAGVKLFFYVSGSPQNFYRRIHAFLEDKSFPLGPLVLKNIGDDNMFAQRDYKVERIAALLEALPDMRVVLVGDSGEKDPEVYNEIKKRFPARVIGCVIRAVERSDVRPERFAGMTVVDDKYANDDVIAAMVRSAPALSAPPSAPPPAPPAPPAPPPALPSTAPKP